MDPRKMTGDQLTKAHEDAKARAVALRREYNATCIDDIETLRRVGRRMRAAEREAQRLGSARLIRAQIA